MKKCDKGVGLIKSLLPLLSRKNISKIYNALVRQNLSYSDILYDQPHTNSLTANIEAVHQAFLAITGVKKSISSAR